MKKMAGDNDRIGRKLRLTEEKDANPVLEDTDKHPALYPWSYLEPKPWPFGCKVRVRNGLVKPPGEEPLPIMMKLFANQREKRFLWQLQEVPGLPKIVGIADGYPYAMLTERYPGRSLRFQRLLMRPTSIMQALMQLCCTLHSLHSRGLVHGAVKLDNVIVGRDEKGEVRTTLIDLTEASTGTSTEADLEGLRKIVCKMPFCFSRHYTRLRRNMRKGNNLSAWEVAQHIHQILKGDGDEEATLKPPKAYILRRQMELPPEAWPKPKGLQEVLWSTISPKSWWFMPLRPVRNATLSLNGLRMPVVVKSFPPSHEKEALYHLRDVKGIATIVAATHGPPQAIVIGRYGSRTLRNLLTSPWRKLEVLQSTCRILDVLHSKGIIHGDLKPENVTFDPRRQSPQATLINLQSARHVYGMETPRRENLVREELGKLYGLLKSIKGLRGIAEYRTLRENAKKAVDQSQPMSAAAMAHEVKSILNIYRDRPSTLANLLHWKADSMRALIFCKRSQQKERYDVSVNQLNLRMA